MEQSDLKTDTYVAFRTGANGVWVVMTSERLISLYNEGKDSTTRNMTWSEYRHTLLSSFEEFEDAKRHAIKKMNDELTATLYKAELLRDHMRLLEDKTSA